MAQSKVEQKPGMKIADGEFVRRVHVSDISVEIWFKDESVLRVTAEDLHYLRTRVIENGMNRDDGDD